VNGTCDGPLIGVEITEWPKKAPLDAWVTNAPSARAGVADTRIASTADLKSLHHKLRTRSGTSDR
jgi:hypothetical protein